MGIDQSVLTATIVFGGEKQILSRGHGAHDAENPRADGRARKPQVFRHPPKNQNERSLCSRPFVPVVGMLTG